MHVNKWHETLKVHQYTCIFKVKKAIMRFSKLDLAYILYA